MDGNVHTYKAHLVAKDFTQTYGVDYEETFSPVADIRAIRILIAIAALYDYEIWQMDVKTAFLNGYLDEDIYMVQLECFVYPNHPRKVCKFQRFIYGLKQASRSWNKIFYEEIKRFRFAQNLDEFNTIITSLKALDGSFSSRNHVRKFLRARPKDLEISKSKKEKYKSLALKERKVLSEEEATSSNSDDEEYAMTVFVVGCWSDSGDDSKKEEICLMALDNNEEFDNEVQFGAFCDANGITYNFLAPRTPQSNGVVERKNRTLQEMSRTMLNEQSVLQKFWCNAVDTSTYILNRILIRPFLGKTPYELFKGTKWVFKNKLDENGVISRNKARLVAQGYNQQEGIDFDETYALIARLESIRILLAYACAHDFKLFQIDVKSAFLNGFINEEVYVAQPPGFVNFEKPNHVFKLKKAPYGLKQAPKAWYDRLKAFLLDHMHTMSLVDNTLLTKKMDSHIIIVQIYVDDFIFGSTCQDLCDDFSKIMHDEFEMSMLGELNFFLGLQIKKLEDDIFFNQSKYIKEMLKKFGLEDSKPIKTPMSSKTKLTRDEDGELVNDTKYRGMIGSLLYLTVSRSDIMFSICLCAHFQEAPKTSHLEAVKRIFRYIKRTTHLGLWYPKGTRVETIIYADSDHAGDYVDRKSTSDVCTFMKCYLTSWFSKKQTALAISTTEAEYVSAGKACQQALWMKQALVDYNIVLDDIPILCDNKGAIDLSKNPQTSSIITPTDYQTAPPSSLNGSPPPSLIATPGISPSKLLLTPKSIPPPLTSPPPAPTQPSKHSLPLTISLDPVELLFLIPPISPQAFFDSIKDLPPRTTNPPPPRPFFESIERLANEPPPLPSMEPPLLPLPPTLPPIPMTLPSTLPPLPPLGPNNTFPLLTHEMFCDHCQRTQVIVDNLRDEMHFILNHILDRLNVLAHSY
ncbi:retrovirus-related pol polyprotein from transposon TNT 1-94 [Tanacetum coccineum]